MHGEKFLPLLLLYLLLLLLLDITTQQNTTAISRCHPNCDHSSPVTTAGFIVAEQ